jgi:hypothetical protein
MLKHGARGGAGPALDGLLPPLPRLGRLSATWPPLCNFRVARDTLHDVGELPESDMPTYRQLR